MNLQQLRKWRDNILIQSNIESHEMDDKLIQYIKWFCYFDSFNEAEDLVSKLSPSQIWKWEETIKNYAKDPISFKEDYMRHVEKQANPENINTDDIDYTGSMDKLESSYITNSKLKDDYYKIKLSEKIFRDQKKKIKIKWKAIKKNKIPQIDKNIIPENREKKKNIILQRKELSYNFYPFEIDGKFVIEWYKKGRKNFNKKKKVYESFIFLWISFNAFYEEVEKENSWDRNAWEKLCNEEVVISKWNNMKNSIEINQFREFLWKREVLNNDWIRVRVWWLWNCSKDTMFDEWDFWDSPKEFIEVIYRIRNNLFHWWKIPLMNDNDLLLSSSSAFIVFLDNLYWFNDGN